MQISCLEFFQQTHRAQDWYHQHQNWDKNKMSEVLKAMRLSGNLDVPRGMTSGTRYRTSSIGDQTLRTMKA